MRMGPKFKILCAVVLGICLSPLIAAADSLFTFSYGSAISSSKLNANFTLLWNKVHAITSADITDGTIVNADIADTTIDRAKLAAGASVSRVWAEIATPAASCSSHPCTITVQYPAAFISSVTRVSQGVYTVNLTSARANANYVAQVGALSAPADAGPSETVACRVTGQSTTTVSVLCVDTVADGGAPPADSGFTFTMWDDA